jgi:uncharacterized protein (TIGR03382 family)
MSRAVTLALLLVPGIASAHFHLDAPPAEYTQTSLGDPQKSAPCGPVGEGGTETGMITSVMTGTSFTLKITETVTHPGHYRIAIAQTEADLPPEPAVTPGSTACGSVPIDPNPSLPVLADGVFVHTKAFTGPQTTQIQLPAGMTCTNCVVQVLEFMSNHAAPCFYHHCAIVNVTDNPTDAGVDGHGADGGSCSSTGSSSPWIAFALLALCRRRRVSACGRGR